MKKLFTLFLLSLLPLVASADVVEIDGIKYNLIPKGNAAEVVKKYSYVDAGYSGDVVIPESVTYDDVTYSVTSISSSAFFNCKDLTSISLPNSLKSIGTSAFSGCTSLTTIVVPNGVEEIGESAFSYCSGLVSVSIPATVISIGGSAFNKCDALEYVYISDLAHWCNINFTGSIFSIAPHIYINDEEVTDFVIPKTVESISSYAFSGFGNMTSITIPSSVTNIGNEVFKNCIQLQSVEIPNSVQSIGSNAFEGCIALNAVDIPNGVQSIGSSVFRNCRGLTSIAIPGSVKDIGDAVFSGCINLVSANIAYGITKIGVSFMSGCNSLTSLEIPNSVTSIGSMAFYECHKLASVNIPNSVKTIGDDAFWLCKSLTTITIPNSITIVDYGTFNSCSSLVSVSIPNSVTKICSRAFYYCKDLKDVYCYAENVPQTDATAFDDSYPEYITLHVPEGCVDAYKAVEPWKNFKEIVSIVETKYTLTYKVDGEVYKTYELLEGATITPEPAPTKEGYGFSGWSTIPATMPAEDVTVTGSFTLLTDEDEITIKEIGKTTWCSNYDLDFTNVVGVKAYIAIGYDDIDKTIWLARVMKVPAGTGLLLKGDAGTYKIPHANVRSTYVNYLKGNLGETISIGETDGDMTNYYLSGKDGTFKSVNDNANIGKNKAYLQLPTSVFAGTRSIGISYDDEDGTTGIKNIAPALSEGDGEWYTLQGQPVVKPGKGLYIKNGKKVVIK